MNRHSTAALAALFLSLPLLPLAHSEVHDQLPPLRRVAWELGQDAPGGNSLLVIISANAR